MNLLVLEYKIHVVYPFSMALNKTIRDRIDQLKRDFDRLKQGKDALLQVLDEAEIPENVYNSNAIENSTLSLQETERILLEQEVARNVALREVYEAKNLATVSEYIRNKQDREVTLDFILLLHRMFMANVDDDIVGRFREGKEYVRVGTHIPPAPEKIPALVSDLLETYRDNSDMYMIDRVALFHLEFESIHPFNDGNGRVGRVLINLQLMSFGYPGLMIRDKEKKEYYKAFNVYQTNKRKTNGMEKVIALGLMESLHKRLTYLNGDEIIPLAEYGKMRDKNISALLNGAKRQSIPAFREKGTWKIGKNYEPK